LDGGLIEDLDPVGEVVPQSDIELGGGFGQAEEGIAAIATRSLRIPQRIFRLMTWQRISCADPSAWSGMCGRSRTVSNSALLACSLASGWSSVAKPVRRLKMRSNLARISGLRRLEGSRL
jgi:hypothetical protein